MSTYDNSMDVSMNDPNEKSLEVLKNHFNDTDKFVIYNAQRNPFMSTLFPNARSSPVKTKTATLIEKAIDKSQALVDMNTREAELSQARLN